MQPNDSFFFAPCGLTPLRKALKGIYPRRTLLTIEQSTGVDDRDMVSRVRTRS